MRPRLAPAYVLLSGLLLGPLPLAAQGDIRLGLGAGVVFPVRSYADRIERGWLGSANLTFFPMASTSLGLRLDGLYGRSPLNGFDGHHSMVGGTASLVFQFGARRSPNRLYVFAGGGYVRTAIRSPGFSQQTETNPALSGGAGVTFGGHGMALFAEARYMSVYSAGLKPQFTPLVAGISFGGL
jgi:hypothetical protein